mmetsp:Transcript_43420/g.102946  ORF Transcript_43420/g.102946 Transcript_43420/m.102946 type:complete len:87 (-) Transcript_43420:698-958(-)
MGNYAYHNKAHVTDVTVHLGYLLSTTGYGFACDLGWKRCILAAITAATVHDLRHPGTTNAFQVAAKTQLFARHGSKVGVFEDTWTT